MAEETGLLVEIDEHVLVDAVQRVSDWHAASLSVGFSEVAINVTARRLSDPRFADDVIDKMDGPGLPPRASRSKSPSGC